MIITREVSLPEWMGYYQLPSLLVASELPERISVLSSGGGGGNVLIGGVNIQVGIGGRVLVGMGGAAVVGTAVGGN